MIDVAPQSPAKRALQRLLANRAALMSLLVLAVIILTCCFGPFFAPNAYDRVFASYVRVPPSLTPYPDMSLVQETLTRIASRLHAEIKITAQDNTHVALTLTTTRPLDERNLALFPRSDVFDIPTVAPHAANDLTLTLTVPIKSATFLFGTDGNGRDLFTRTLIAGQISLAIGLIASLVALIIGVAYGACAGFIGGAVDNIMMRCVDILYALPFIFFVILLVVFFGRNFVLVFIAIGAVEWLDMARIVRGQTLALKNREFVQAADAMGVAPRTIILRHIIPNLLGPVVVYLTLLTPRVILLESFLSFLGLGVQEPRTSWGVLISEGARSIEGASYLLIIPALFLSITLLCLNFIGDGLRDALDPKEY